MLQVIDLIDLNKCKPYKDFGKGVYVTDIEEQAENLIEEIVKDIVGIYYAMYRQ